MTLEVRTTVTYTPHVPLFALTCGRRQLQLGELRQLLDVPWRQCFASGAPHGRSSHSTHCTPSRRSRAQHCSREIWCMFYRQVYWSQRHFQQQICPTVGLHLPSTSVTSVIFRTSRIQLVLGFLRLIIIHIYSSNDRPLPRSFHRSRRPRFPPPAET